MAEAAVALFALEQPAFGQVRVTNELRKRSIFISSSGARTAWLRRGLESFKKRLIAPERHVSQTGEVLTEAQVVVLEKKQEDDMARWKSRLNTLGIWAVRIRFTWVPSKAWVVFISRPLWTPTPSGPRPSCIRPRHRSPLPTCSMTGSWRSSKNRACVF